jgi:NTP pyrophosphatase (non-canonical NTP hydrolase)
MTEHDAVCLVFDALHNKAYRHPPFHSHHETYGVLLEEVDEYFEHVRERRPSMAGYREELADIAAVCIKALIQLCVDESEVNE